MNVLNTLTKNDIENVVCYFIRKNILNDIPFEENIKIVIYGVIFDKPCYESIRYLVKIMISYLNVSKSVYYWILACLFELSHYLCIDMHDIHVLLIMLHCIGTKIIEDIPYDTCAYLNILDIDSKEGIEIEMGIFMILLKYFDPIELLRKKNVDETLFKSISSCCFMDVNFLRETEKVLVNRKLDY